MHELPENVIAFLIRNIDSAEQLEILLLLKDSPEREWAAEEVSQALSTQASSGGTYLADLHSKGILAMKPEPNGPRYRYRPQAPGLDRTISDLAQAYSRYRVRMISLIYSKPIDKIQTFSEAFKLRKEDE